MRFRGAIADFSYCRCCLYSDDQVLALIQGDVRQLVFQFGDSAFFRDVNRRSPGNDGLISIVDNRAKLTSKVRMFELAIVFAYLPVIALLLFSKKPEQGS